MQRLTSYLLVVCLSLLGTGALQHLHNLTHLNPPAIADEHASCHHAGSDQLPHNQPSQPFSDHKCCDLCLRLHQPAVCLNWSGVLIGISELVARVAPVTLLYSGSTAVERIDCRGPPGCSLRGS
jgi:hypothetical protein